MAKKYKTPTGLPPASDFVDYHESDEAMIPIYLLGRIALEWNYCEHLVGTLIWHYVGGFERGLTVTTNLGNKSRADLLLNLARRFEKNKEMVSRIEFVAASFNKLREARNILLHSHSLDPNEDGDLEWRRASQSSSKQGHVSSTMNAPQMMILLDTTAHVSKFCLELLMHQIQVQKRKPKGERAPLPDIFQLPDILPRNPQPAPKGERRPPGSSPGSRKGK